MRKDTQSGQAIDGGEGKAGKLDHLGDLQDLTKA